MFSAFRIISKMCVAHPALEGAAILIVNSIVQAPLEQIIKLNHLIKMMQTSWSLQSQVLNNGL